jgi:hypothetical protein
MRTALSTEELREMLETGAEIDAYCISCDEHWLISTEERADIARDLERAGKPQLANSLKPSNFLTGLSDGRLLLYSRIVGM